MLIGRRRKFNEEEDGVDGLREASATQEGDEWMNPAGRNKRCAATTSWRLFDMTSDMRDRRAEEASYWKRRGDEETKKVKGSN